MSFNVDIWCISEINTKSFNIKNSEITILVNWNSKLSKWVVDGRSQGFSWFKRNRQVSNRS